MAAHFWQQQGRDCVLNGEQHLYRPRLNLALKTNFALGDIGPMRCQMFQAGDGIPQLLISNLLQAGGGHPIARVDVFEPQRRA